jgi:hypothetical protein
MLEEQPPNDPPIIEERSNKNGNSIVRQYARKRFLGKGGFARCF